MEKKAKTLFVEYVDPYIGTDYHGHVFLGVNMPFGAVQLGPTNFTRGWDWCSGYHYTDSLLIGFAHTHLSGTGIGDLGDVLLMPTTGRIKPLAGSPDNLTDSYVSKYTHEHETAKVGYYAVKLLDYDIKAELTASKRVGFHKYTYPQSDASHIIINLKDGIGWDKVTETELQKIDNTTVVGKRFSRGWAKNQQLFFALKTSKPFKEFQLFGNQGILIREEATSEIVHTAVLSFETKREEKILVKVGISPVSTKNALLNIEEEIPHWDFEKTYTESKEAWNTALSRIHVKTKNTSQLRIFYTALYHTMIFPSLFNDVNGDYRGTDKKIYRNATFDNYTVFSLWDTYRAAHPLFTITQPKRVADMIQSMIAIDEQQGKLPVWHLQGCETNTMVGYHAVPVIVDAYLKGLSDIEGKKILKAVKNTAMLDEEGRNFIKEKGYIPADSLMESVAKALEYAIDDWCIAQLALRLGEKSDYDYFSKRAKYYRQYFDKTTGFVRGKMADGNWRIPFDPISSKHRDDDYCEGNAWQYTWLIPHDVEGLIGLFGDEDIFTAKLDSLFIVSSKLGEGASSDITGLIGQYAHGNEPSHHTSYLYAYAGKQWKTAEKVRKIVTELYTDKPDGLCGNEDCGQMSAWYIFNAMGFYPVNPVNGAYVLGSPLFDEVKIALENGKTFRISIRNNSDENIYIQSVKLNGENYSKSYITHKDIMNGGELKIQMGKLPNKSFGQASDARPRSILYH